MSKSESFQDILQTAEGTWEVYNQQIRGGSPQEPGEVFTKYLLSEVRGGGLSHLTDTIL